MTENDIKFLKIAIENSRKSMQDGNFPAGGVVAKDGEILSSTTSSPHPSLLHPDSKAVIEAFNKSGGDLKGATLYIGLESCMMCTGVTFWGGIRRVVYACSKVKVNPNYYETPQDLKPFINNFNEKIDFIHAKEFEEEALQVVKEWEESNSAE